MATIPVVRTARPPGARAGRRTGIVVAARRRGRDQTAPCVFVGFTVTCALVIPSDTMSASCGVRPSPSGSEVRGRSDDRELKLTHEIARVDMERRGDLEDLDEVEPSFPALILRDEGLRPSEQVGELSLRDASRPAGLGEPLAEPPIGRAED